MESPDSMDSHLSLGNYTIGEGAPLLLIAGPCVIESREHTLWMAKALAGIARRHPVQPVFKASFDKANRSAAGSFRGPGFREGLEILGEVRATTGLPVLTDVHETAQVEAVAEVVDVLQIPAFLCRQTDLLVAAARTGRLVNVKKGQFLSPYEVANVVEKVHRSGSGGCLITERGFSFGYQNLVVDMRSLVIIRQYAPVIFDATHSVQQPGGLGKSSGGQREFSLPLARAAAAVGIDGLFCEVHDHPEKALSDGPNQIPLAEFENYLCTVLKFDQASRQLK
jgi:2-dehydro-3-deoxyphosphooctonate aldolase (KDO 8-P synthase)